MNYGEEINLTFNLNNNDTDTSQSTAEQLFQELKSNIELAKQNLQEAQERQTLYANENRKELTFKVDDSVMLSTANLRAKGRSAKLLPRFIGPYKVLEVINPVAYKVDIPSSLRIHNVFHVSLLKPYIDGAEAFPDREQVLRPPPEDLNEEGEELWEVEEIVGKRRRKVKKGRRTRMVTEYLVKWKGYPEWENSWEPERGLRQAKETIQAFKNRNRT